MSDFSCKDVFASLRLGRSAAIGYCWRKSAIFGLLMLGTTMPSTSVAQQIPLGSGTVMKAVEGLKKGEYLWAPEMSPEGPVLVVVSLATQRAIAYRNGVPIGVSTVSTGFY